MEEVFDLGDEEMVAALVAVVRVLSVEALDVVVVDSVNCDEMEASVKKEHEGEELVVYEQILLLLTIIRRIWILRMRSMADVFDAYDGGPILRNYL